MRTFLSNAKLFTFLTLGYAAFYFANNLGTEFLYLTPGAHLVHIPSGIKILITLITGFVGACAIFVASILWGLLYAFPSEYGLVAMLSLGSAVVPWLVCKMSSKQFQLDGELSNLSIISLAFIGIGYAFLNTLVTQSILYLSGHTESLWSGMQVMMIGDITGILLVVTLARLINRFINRDRAFSSKKF